MIPNGADEKAMRQYLLGELAPEARELLEERLLTDKDCYEHLLLLEDELVDDYVRGALPNGEKERFDSYFLTTAERRQKLGFARSLRRYVAKVGIPGPAPAKEPFFQALVAGWRGLSPALGLSLAAALLIVMAGGVWSLSLLQKAGALEQQVAEERARSRELAASLDRERQARTALAQQNAARGAPPEPIAARTAQPPPRPTSAVFVLSAGLLRSGGETQRVVLPPDSTLVELHLEIAEEYPRYQAGLSDAEGESLWTLSRLKSTRSEGRTFVPLRLPSELLPRGDYSLKLEGMTAGGDREPIGRYDFRVLLK